MPNTTTATELQRNYRKVVEKAKRLKKPVAVLSNNRPDIVLIAYEVFKKMVKARQEKKGIDAVFGSLSREEADKLNSRIDEMFETIDEGIWS